LVPGEKKPPKFMPDRITGISGETALISETLLPSPPAYGKKADLWGTFLITGTRIV
jgi:hypothetical protein